MRTAIICMCLWASQAAAQCPEPSVAETGIAASGPDLIVPKSWEVTAVGAHAAPCQVWADQGVNAQSIDGFLPVAPSATFELAGMAPHILMVMAEAACDPRLAVRTGDGLWHFAQSANGRQEVVVWSASDGPMQVWVGAADQTSCEASVILETFDR